MEGEDCGEGKWIDGAVIYSQRRPTKVYKNNIMCRITFKVTYYLLGVVVSIVTGAYQNHLQDH